MSSRNRPPEATTRRSAAARLLLTSASKTPRETAQKAPSKCGNGPITRARQQLLAREVDSAGPRHRRCRQIGGTLRHVAAMPGSSHPLQPRSAPSTASPCPPSSNAAAAEAEASAFAARAVSDMDDAVTRIRQEAAKRVATAERERDRAKEQSRVAVTEVKQKKAAIEEMLRQIKLDADTRVRDAEDMMEEWERLAETSRLAKLAAEEAMETKIKAAEEAAAADVAAAEKRAAAKTAEAETALAGAKQKSGNDSKGEIAKYKALKKRSLGELCVPWLRLCAVS